MLIRILALFVVLLGARHVLNKLLRRRGPTSPPVGDPEKVKPPVEGKVIDVDFTEHANRPREKRKD